MSEAGGLSFEEAIERLQTVVAQLESDELHLDESLERFEEGIALYRQCLARLDAAQKRFEVLRDTVRLEVTPPPAAEPEEFNDRPRNW